jgi:hypothetical protein
MERPELGKELADGYVNLYGRLGRLELGKRLVPAVGNQGKVDRPRPCRGFIFICRPELEAFPAPAVGDAYGIVGINVGPAPARFLEKPGLPVAEILLPLYSIRAGCGHFLRLKTPYFA